MVDDANSGAIYTERYVAFIDILGFSDVVRQSTFFPWRVASLISILEQMADPQQYLLDGLLLEADSFKAQSFSDCIVMSENASPGGLLHLLGALTVTSVKLLAKGIFTRGGIAKGLLHHTDKVVFGPAMIEAYRLESTTAKYPRILVDKATHVDYKSPTYTHAGANYSELPAFRFDNDGPPFLDILAPLRLPTADGFEEDIPLIREEIQRSLDEAIYEPKHFEKVRWLAIYWNELALSIGARTVDFPQLDHLNPKKT
ncbi:hypothetical protein [Tardiphaga robiniae]|uniref:hypothetical protein n=1 Tax=Tardiphaga robiniae TaxID=943830 RepID=UPI001586951D|nr:hypothetical protein [Tardiphaga robiniae]NUU44547.1 hypothetical protein [Tardiphaga robiniae]